MLSKSDGEIVWRSKLEAIPSVFARLFYVAGLRNREGAYREAGLESKVPIGIADDIIRDSHLICFRGWLSMGLQHKTEDLRPYLASLLSPRAKSGQGWEKAWADLFRDLIPSDASLTEIKLFLNTASIVQRLVDEE